MDGCNPAKTPVETQRKLKKEGEGEIFDPATYGSFIGSSRYLTHRCSKLTLSISFLSRFLEKPLSEHMTGDKRILRFLKGTTDHGPVVR